MLRFNYLSDVKHIDNYKHIFYAANPVLKPHSFFSVVVTNLIIWPKNYKMKVHLNTKYLLNKKPSAVNERLFIVK